MAANVFLTVPSVEATEADCAPWDKPDVFVQTESGRWLAVDTLADLVGTRGLTLAIDG
ncbi:hypothetical protein [Streptomyces nodosus]|uniref:hypothetical protein n=1 Tax=Streptomyces nodosus TaxID=40318 RepID=UPI00380DE21B